MPQVKLVNVRTDAAAQPRAELTQAVIDDYRDCYKAGVKLPPIDVFDDGDVDVDGDVLWLADGFHRFQAAADAGLDSLPCTIHEGTLGDAEWFSYSANRTHGLRRTNADKQRAVLAALCHENSLEMSDGAIGEHVGVDPKTVAKYRAELEATAEIPESPERTGKDGRTTNTANIGNSTPEPAGDAEAPVCPNCGGTAVRDDGACAACLEPDVVAVEAEVPVEEASAASELAESIQREVTFWLDDESGATPALAAAVLENVAVELRERK